MDSDIFLRLQRDLPPSSPAAYRTLDHQFFTSLRADVIRDGNSVQADAATMGEEDTGEQGDLGLSGLAIGNGDT